VCVCVCVQFAVSVLLCCARRAEPLPCGYATANPVHRSRRHRLLSELDFGGYMRIAARPMPLPPHRRFLCCARRAESTLPCSSRLVLFETARLLSKHCLGFVMAGSSMLLSARVDVAANIAAIVDFHAAR
jgi:hypothetical protein